MTSPSEAAASYAAAGWSVFPLVAGGKTPATLAGYKDATTDPDLVEWWWRQTPDANIGIACGASGLVVIDCDWKLNPDGTLAVCGHNAYWALLAAAGFDEAPDTLEVVTPSGGSHFYFTSTNPAIRNSAGKHGPGLDVRANGGYVVAPPSQTPSGSYRIAERHPVLPLPAELEAVLVPPARTRSSPFNSLEHRLRTAADSRRYGTVALDHELADVRNAAPGTRNHTLVRAAFNLGQLVHRGDLDADDVTLGLLEAAVTAGLSETEAAATIRSGFNGARDKPRGAA